MSRLITRPKPGIFPRAVPAWAANANRQTADRHVAELLRLRRMLVVGPEVSPLYGGIAPSFPSIQQAMDVIPLVDNVEKHNFTDRWVILVTPGYYQEEIHMKPFVTVTGLAPDTVIVQAPPDSSRERSFRGRRATVYMNHHTSLQNIGVLLRADSVDGDYGIWNRSTYPSVVGPTGLPNKSDVSNLGVQNVNIWPAVHPERTSVDDPRGELNPCKAILLEGNFSTVLMTNVGVSYNFTSGYAVEITGVKHVVKRPGLPDEEQLSNADTHFIQCFFDSLFLTPGVAPRPVPGFGFGGGQTPGGFGFGAGASEPDRYAPFDGGCLRVRDCLEVSIRNSLARVASDRDHPRKTGFTNGAALRVEGGAHAIVEGSSLVAPGTAGSDRVLDVEPGSHCTLYHSSADSVRGGGGVTQRGPLPVDANGVILDGQVR